MSFRACAEANDTELASTRAYQGTDNTVFVAAGGSVGTGIGCRRMRIKAPIRKDGRTLTKRTKKEPKRSPAKLVRFGEEEGACGYGVFAALTETAETEWSPLLLTRTRSGGRDALPKRRGREGRPGHFIAGQPHPSCLLPAAGRAAETGAILIELRSSSAVRLAGQGNVWTVENPAPCRVQADAACIPEAAQTTQEL